MHFLEKKKNYPLKIVSTKRKKQIQWDKRPLENTTNKTVAVVNKICLLYSGRKNEDKQTDCNQLYYSATVTVDTCFRHSNSASSVYIHQPVVANIIKSYGKIPCM